MNQLNKAIHVSAGDDSILANRFFLSSAKLSTARYPPRTPGSSGIYDTIRTKRGGPPLHYHQNQDEWFFVREGKFQFQVGDDNFQLTTGDLIFAPRKVPHTFANISEQGILMIAYQPAGTMERFLLDGSQLLLKNPTHEEWQALNRVHGIEIVGPQLKLD